jgi:hypothetical protein
MVQDIMVLFMDLVTVDDDSSIMMFPTMDFGIFSMRRYSLG